MHAMARSLRTLATVVAALGVAATACIATDGFCPCGSDPDDEFAAHDPSFAGEHLVANECVCRCGDDPAIGTKQSEDGECPDDGKACTDEFGRTREFDCY